MATAGGTPPQNTPKPKKEFTDEQKRTFTLLGVMGVLALIVAGIYLPGMLSGGSEPLPVAPSAPDAGPPGGAVATAPTDPSAGAPAVAAAPAAPASGVTTVAAGAGQNSFGIPPKHRSDPFVDFVITPPYVAPPPPPVDLPTPQEIVLPAPVAPIDAQRFNLPSVRIPRFANQTTSPRDAGVPPRVSGAGGSGQPQPSYDKRLSGVVISNGVRALLEINTGLETRTYVVQPGDSVDGITVLNIQRVNEGGRSLMRMLIREAGQEKYVDLKAGAPRADVVPGGTGQEGFEGGPGGFGP